MMANGATRAEQVAMVERDARHTWLAAEIDAVETVVGERLDKLNASVSKLLGIAVGLLISTISILATLLIGLAIS